MSEAKVDESTSVTEKPKAPSKRRKARPKKDTSAEAASTLPEWAPPSLKAAQRKLTAHREGGGKGGNPRFSPELREALKDAIYEADACGITMRQIGLVLGMSGTQVTTYWGQAVIDRLSAYHDASTELLRNAASLLAVVSRVSEKERHGDKVLIEHALLGFGGVEALDTLTQKIHAFLEDVDVSETGER